MRPNWPKFAGTLVLWCILCFQRITFLINTSMDFATAGEWECVAAFKRFLVLYYYVYLSRDMRFQSMWYVRPAKAQTSLRIRAV